MVAKLWSSITTSMLTPFDPHPNWRRNFEFTAAFKRVEPTYKLDPIIESTVNSSVEFELDPVLHKYSWPPKTSV